MASAKVEHYLNEQPRGYKHGQEVDLLVWQKTDLGFKVIVDNQYPGLIYEDQVFQYVHTGDRLKGYISTVRRDGKIDCTLQPTGQQHAEDFAETLLQYLKITPEYVILAIRAKQRISNDVSKYRRRCINVPLATSISVILSLSNRCQYVSVKIELPLFSIFYRTFAHDRLHSTNENEFSFVLVCTIFE